MQNEIIKTQKFVHPDTVVSHFHLREGEKVADFGAGSGYFISNLASAVGASGVVYACEIQKNLVEAIGNLARTKHLDQVQVLWCDLEEVNGIKIESETLDAGILVNTLFQLDEKSTAIQEIMRTLRSGGRFFLIDWSESFGGLGPQPVDIVDSASARALCESNGLVFDREYDAGEHHYGLAFRKV